MWPSMVVDVYNTRVSASGRVVIDYWKIKYNSKQIISDEINRCFLNEFTLVNVNIRSTSCPCIQVMKGAGSTILHFMVSSFSATTRSASSLSCVPCDHWPFIVHVLTESAYELEAAGAAGRGDVMSSSDVMEVTTPSARIAVSINATVTTTPPVLLD